MHFLCSFLPDKATSLACGVLNELAKVSVSDLKSRMRNICHHPSYLLNATNGVRIISSLLSEITLNICAPKFCCLCMPYPELS